MTTAAGSPAAAEQTGTYDPGQWTVAEVVAYVQAHPGELDAVYDAEAAGKARSTLLAQLDGMR